MAESHAERLVRRMSEELLFDSERQEKRAVRKRRLIPILALAGVILLAVILALILRATRAKVHNGGDDTMYPYTWQNKSDGRIQLDISHENAPDYQWAVTSTEDQPVLSAVVDRENRESTRLLLNPERAGRGVLQLALRRELPPEQKKASKTEEEGVEPETRYDILYELSLLLEVTENENELVGSVLSEAGIQRQANVSGGQDSENPYRIYADGKFLVVAIAAASVENDWQCEILSGEASVTDLGLTYVNGEARLYLGAGTEPGVGELAVKSETAAAELRLRVVRQADASLLLEEHTAQFGEKNYTAPPDKEENMDGNNQQNDPNAVVDAGEPTFPAVDAP